MIAKFRAKVLKILPIPEEECDAYFKEVRQTKNLAAKEYFVREGEVCREMTFVNHGVLRMFYTTEDGKEINTRFFFEDDFVAAFQSFLTQRPGRYSIQALKDCELVTIPFTRLLDAYNNSSLWGKFGRIIAEKSYISAEQYTESLLFYNSEERYLKLLKAHPKVFEQVPLYHIASYLGIERESLSRLRKKLAMHVENVT